MSNFMLLLEGVRIFAVSFLLIISFSLGSSSRGKIVTGSFPILGIDEMFATKGCTSAPISISDISTG